MSRKKFDDESYLEYSDRNKARKEKIKRKQNLAAARRNRAMMKEASNPQKENWE